MDSSGKLVEIPQITNYWIVFLSYCVSVLGMVTTLELLGKRSSQSGSNNWFRLFGAAFSSGFVGIWGMHFIGMRACILNDGKKKLRFSTWYTILSLIIPIVVLSLAFYSIGAQPQVNLKRILVGGAMAGSSIAFMHYCGQFAITEFVIRYDTVYLVLSIIIAITAATIALYIFFNLQSKWKNSWYKKLGTAMLMSIAVCGMHYTAYAGTHYFDDGKPVQDNDFLSDNLFIGLLALGCSVVCATLLGIVIYYAKKSEILVQKIALGAAIYNEEGMVLVSIEGLLPLVTIGDNEEFNQLSLDDDVFHSIYQLTNEWDAVNQWLPHVEEAQKMQNKRKISRSTIFIESFMLNARQLADSLNIPLVDSGVLYDQILFTGSEPSSAEKQQALEKINLNNEDLHTISTSSTYSSMYDQPQSLQKDGKGQILFIVKQFKSSEYNKYKDKWIIENFLKLGFRFADPRLIAPIMAQKVGVPVRQMQSYLERMFQYSNSGIKPFLEADCVYAGLFITRNEKYYGDVNSTKNDLEILVMENYRHQIPVSKLPTIKTIGEIEMAHIKSKEGIHLGELILQLRTSFLGATTNLDLKRNSKQYIKSNKTGNSSDNLKDDINSLNLSTQQNDVLEGFRYELMQALHRLTHIVSEEQLYSNAKLVPKIFDIPIPDIISQKDTDTTNNQINQKFAKLIIFDASFPANVKPKLSRGEVCFLPFSMFEVYQNILFYNSKRFYKFMQEPDVKQNTKGKRIVNNVNNNRTLNDCEEIEMNVIENNNHIEIVAENKLIQNLMNLLHLKLSKDIRQNDSIQNIDEKRWYQTILENYINDEINNKIEIKINVNHKIEIKN
ncbi:hypothetical protein C2G38_2006304 [Gigaspora rosea]|uniref:MHYT domain-containing protein n=1 Tax=Gigaspora rosea TaxID=44941 RepID=A0A397UH32_9GLOM|nr:hypothetical protein C2G38_2006304 [Gigaspora rosea]